MIEVNDWLRILLIDGAQLLDVMQQHMFEPNAISFNAVMHVRREDSGRWCYSYAMRCATATRWDVAAQAGAWWDQLQCGHQLLREDNGVGKGTVLLFHCEHRVSRAFISWSGRAKTFIIGWYAWIIDMELGWQIWMDYRYESWLVGVHGSYIDTELVGRYALFIDRELD